MDSRVGELLQRPENKFCADCHESSPRWCSVTLGVFICTECAGIHRKLGTHISFVQSASLDKLKDIWIERLSRIGNSVAAERYEVRFPSCWTRPRAHVISGDRVDAMAAQHLERFIRAKYEHRLFAPRWVNALMSFYDALRQQHIQDQRRMQTSGARITSATKNLQELYINDAQRDDAYDASATFLGNHSDWLQGPGALDSEALTARIALQHFVSIDIQDLSLEEDKRRSNDTFVTDGLYANMSEQFVKNATRSMYCIGDQDFNYSDECSSRGHAVETHVAEVGAFADDFMGRLVTAVSNGLGSCPEPILLRAVSTLMSQSGLAQLERACAYCSPPSVVSGGKQVVCYTLKSCASNTWEISLSLKRMGFSQAVIHGSEGSNILSYCSPDSVIAKSCSLRLALDSGGKINIDVISLEDRLEIRDENGMLHDVSSRSPLDSASNCFVESFRVLLRRGENAAPFGLAPCRLALRRGVLKLKGTVGTGTVAEEWNARQENASTQLCQNDIVLSINGVAVSPEDAAAAALLELKQQQVLLDVRRLRPVTNGFGYPQLVVRAYASLNPVKLDSIISILAKQSARTVFFAVCRKYAQNFDDWNDLLKCFLSCKKANAARVVANAEEHLKRLKPGEEASLIKAVCKRLIDDAPSNGSATNEGDPQRTSQREGNSEHSAWPQVLLTLQLTDSAAPLGMRHDRNALHEKSILLVKDVLPGTPAAVAGLCAGDVVTHIGSRPAAGFVLGGGKIANVVEADGSIMLRLQRSPRKIADVDRQRVASPEKVVPAGESDKVAALKTELQEAREMIEQAGAKNVMSADDDEVVMLRRQLDEARRAATANVIAATSAVDSVSSSEVLALKEQLEEARAATVAVVANGSAKAPSPRLLDSEAASLKKELEAMREQIESSHGAPNAEVETLREQLEEARGAVARDSSASQSEERAATIESMQPAAPDAEIEDLRVQLEEARAAAASASATFPPEDRSEATDMELARLRAELAEAARFKDAEEEMLAERTRANSLLQEATERKAALENLESSMVKANEEQEIKMLEKEMEQLRVTDALDQERQALAVQRQQLHTLARATHRLSTFSSGMCETLRLDDSDENASSDEEADAYDLDWSAVKAEELPSELGFDAKRDEEVF